LIFIHGLMSDMNGQKSVFFNNHCRKENISFLCFDFSGHGKSNGDFINFGIKDWYKNLKDLINYLNLIWKLRKSKSFHCFNVGPKKNNHINVKKLASFFLSKNQIKISTKKNKFKEKKYLYLDTKKIRSKINVYDSPLDSTVGRIFTWYKTFYQKRENINNLSIRQIKDYLNV